MKKFDIESGKEFLTGHSGLVLIGMLLNTTDLDHKLDKVILSEGNNGNITHSDIVKSMVGLLTCGKTTYEEIDVFKYIPYFSEALGINQCPSAATLRQRLDGASDQFNSVIKSDENFRLKAVLL